MIAESFPNVKILESDYSYRNVVDPSINVACFTGEFERGPVNAPVLITSDVDLKNIFGTANSKNYNDWYQVYNFLQYGSQRIYVCRSVGSHEFSSNNGNVCINPGSWGDLLKVEIYKVSELNQPGKESIRETYEYYREGRVKDFFIIIKEDELIVETLYMNDNDELRSNYLQQINLIEGIYELSGGYADSPTSADMSESLSLFTKEDYEIDIILSSEMFNEENIKLAEDRKDCVCFFGIPRYFITYLVVNGLLLTTERGMKIASSVQQLNHVITDRDIENIIEYVNNLQKSSYAFCVFGFKMQTDEFTGKNRAVNVIGDIAGLKAAASVENPWVLGAGIERGTVKNLTRDVMKLKSYQKDLLMRYNVNSLYNMTLLSQQLFVDDSFMIQKLHNRNIFNYLKRASVKIANRYLFELNTANMRYTLSMELRRLLEDMISRRGITAGKVVVKPLNENNIDVDIYLAITGVSEIVKLNFINIGTRDVSEILQIRQVQ